MPPKVKHSIWRLAVPISVIVLQVAAASALLCVSLLPGGHLHAPQRQSRCRSRSPHVPLCGSASLDPQEIRYRLGKKQQQQHIPPEKAHSCVQLACGNDQPQQMQLLSQGDCRQAWQGGCSNRVDLQAKLFLPLCRPAASLHLACQNP